jgi:hypothetical protein
MYRARGIFVISIQYGPLGVRWVDWKVALKPRRNIILGLNLCYHKEKNKSLSKNRGLCVNKYKL